jgi:diguanylate cyclase (GGDEF)-like protein
VVAARHAERACRLALAFAVLPFAVLLFAAPPFAGAQQYSFRYFGYQDGLTNLAVSSVYQDRVGFIWLNTENGIYRYDGSGFESFGQQQGLAPQSAVAFGDAPDGSLLAGGSFGLYRFAEGRFEKLALPIDAVSATQGIASDNRGHTYVATGRGLVELAMQPGQPGFSYSLRARPPNTSSPAAHSVLLKGNVIWYGCGEEICRVAGSETTVLGLESRLPRDRWQTILEDRDGAIWVSGSRSGILERPAGQALFLRPAAHEIAGALHGIPAIDADGRILLPSSTGLFISTRHGWHRIDRAAGLRGTVDAIFEDRQQSLWIGLVGRGLAQWTGYRQWESYTIDSGLGSDLVYTVLPRPDGSVWVATGSGMYHGQPTQFGYRWQPFPPLADVPVHSLQMDADGNLWAGTDGRGAMRIHPATGAFDWFDSRQGLTGQHVYALRFDRAHRLWAATSDGLFVAQPPYAQFARSPGLPQSLFWALAEGKNGSIWAGGAGGLYRNNGGQWRNWTRASGLSNQEVLSIGAGPDGSIWVGYSYGGGIDRLRPVANGGFQIKKGVQRPGTTGIVYFLDFDSSGRLWAGTDHGLDVWNGSRWSHYDEADGLVWDDCDLNAFAESADGRSYWIGTSGGLSHFKPRPHGAPTVPVRVVFTRLLLGQKDITDLHDPSFDMDDNALTAQFSALNVIDQSELIFRYRLLGASAAWTEASQHAIQFVNVAPGHYQLEVEAGNGLGNWSGHPAAFVFVILAPWYRTWWFIAICIVVPLLAIFATLRMRVAGARARESELMRMVEEKTADLQRANEELLRLSSTDSLTGLANRRTFDRTLERECARILRSGVQLSLILFDVDHFKALNDTLGHQRGDLCLAMLAGEMERVARRSVDLAARFGGEEFAMILPNTGAEGARLVADMVRQAFADLNLPHPASPIASCLTVSAGVAAASRDLCSLPEELIAAADQALYVAKRRGRNRVIVAGSPPVDSVESGQPGFTAP